MNLEERVVAAEVASRRADGPGVIEVQSQLRSDVAGQGLGPEVGISDNQYLSPMEYWYCLIRSYNTCT